MSTAIKKAYQYNHEKYYISETTAYNNRLPHNCTYTKPTQKQGFIPRWNGSSWDSIEDHRQKKDLDDVIIEGTGTPYWLPGDPWNSPPRYMVSPGPLPKNALLSPPEQPEHEALIDAKKEKLYEIQSAYTTARIDALAATKPSTATKESNTPRAIDQTLIAKRIELEQAIQQARNIQEVNLLPITFTL